MDGCSWFVIGLYVITAIFLLWYMLKYEDRRFGKFIWFGWVLNVMFFMIGKNIFPEHSLLPFWQDVVLTHAAITLIARTLYSIKARKNGRDSQYFTSVANVFRTNFSSSSDGLSGNLGTPETVEEGYRRHRTKGSGRC